MAEAPVTAIRVYRALAILLVAALLFVARRHQCVLREALLSEKEMESFFHKTTQLMIYRVDVTAVDASTGERIVARWEFKDKRNELVRATLGERDKENVLHLEWAASGPVDILILAEGYLPEVVQVGPKTRETRVVELKRIS